MLWNGKLLDAVFITWPEGCSRPRHYWILRGSLKQEIQNDFTQFFNSHETYERCGIPWRPNGSKEKKKAKSA